MHKIRASEIKKNVSIIYLFIYFNSNQEKKNCRHEPSSINSKDHIIHLWILEVQNPCTPQNF